MKKTKNALPTIPERKDIIEFVKTGKFSFDHIVRALSKDAKSKGAISARLKAMVRDSQLVVNADSSLAINTKDQRTGKIFITEKGFGFLQIDGEKDWFIPQSETSRCFSGELVLAMAKNVGEKGTTGKIIGQTALLKNVVLQVKTENKTFASLDGNHFVPIKLVDDSGEEVDLKSGSWLRGDFIKGPSGPRPHEFKILEVLSETSPVEDIRFREMQPKGFQIAHSPEVEAEATEACSKALPAKIDLRHIPFVSIDSAYARDLDDLVYVKRLEDGKYNLMVAIADVSRYVKNGTKLDDDAKSRGISLYTPGKSFSMLPGIIAHNICSLLPHAEKNAMVVDIIISSSGEIEKYRFMEAVVSSKKRFSYKRVQELSDGADPDKDEMLHLNMLKAAYELTNLRKEVGKLSGEMIIRKDEPRAKFSESGDIESFYFEPQLESNDVIKEMMILANVSAALFLKRNAQPSLFRHHPGLQEEGLVDINAFLGKLGLPLLDKNTNRAVCAYLEEVIPEEHEAELSFLLRKAMTNARSHAQKASHFGMGLTHYAHFTSPIRRYADIVVHRSIKSILKKSGHEVDGAYSYSEGYLSGLAIQLTERAHQSSIVERNIINKLVCRWWSLNPRDCISGVVSTVTDKVVYIRMANTPIDGEVLVSVFEKKAGEPPKKGQHVDVSIDDINSLSGKIKLTLLQKKSTY